VRQSPARLAQGELSFGRVGRVATFDGVNGQRPLEGRDGIAETPELDSALTKMQERVDEITVVLGQRLLVDVDGALLELDGVATAPAKLGDDARLLKIPA
jgi:hypothetical protein